ncbi:MAG: hypothetical protein F6K16_27240 [Symploca sp. SIO2B6]|nr:hypothetical protein [Symploca sp. SIO2B6]
MVFSLGNSFQTVPLNQLIDSDILLQLLQPLPEAGINAVVHHLFAESTHPPIYFALAHLWMKLFPSESGLVSISAARSLSTLFGIVSIPAVFGLSYLAFGSLLISQLAAAIMAVSPFGVFLAQEARHYTLAVLLVIASLCCLVTAVKNIHLQKTLPISVALIWVAVNCLGIATHYFFVLTLGAQGSVLLGQAWRQTSQDIKALLQPHWQRIYTVVVGTSIGCLVWLPALQAIHGSAPTKWIYDGNPRIDWLAPIGRFLLWAISSWLMLPSAVTTIPLAVVIISGIVTLLFLFWTLPSLSSGLKYQQQHPDTRLATQILVEYLLGAIALFFVFTYGLGMDLTLAPRFQFVYFPALIVLLGAALATCWQAIPIAREEGNSGDRNSDLNPTVKPYKQSGFKPKISLRVRKYRSILQLNPPLQPKKIIVIFILLMGLVGGLTINFNLGYLQNHRPDLLAPIIQKASIAPTVIATTHDHHGQTGRMMGLAWEFKRLSASNGEIKERKIAPQFFLAHRDPNTRNHDHALKVLQAQLTQLPRPLDLWLVDFRTKVDLKSQQCVADSKYRSLIGGYKYKLYRCS